jgi:hypothetical protein
MPGLRDLAKKLRRTVIIAGEEFAVRGLTATEMAELLGTYPEMAKIMRGGFDQVDAEALQAQAPECVALMIALGSATNGKAPDQADLEDARSLPGAAALDLLAAIAELSLPRSVVRPFVAMVTDGEAIELSADTGKAPDTI